MKMTISCFEFCVIFLISVCISEINGQNNTILNTATLSPGIKPTTNSFYQTKGFNSSEITSGPILIIDRKNIFISNIHFNGENKDARFWAGMGQPSSTGWLIPDEDNSKGSLKTYNGENIYLQLPENLTTDHIDYIAIWLVDEKTEIDHVMLYENASSEVRNNIPEALGYHNITEDSKRILRFPTCCPRNTIYENSTCVPAEAGTTFTLPVFNSNATHIDPDQLMEDIEYAPYYYNIRCNVEEGYRGAALTEEEVPGLIYNSSLIYYVNPSDYGFYKHGSYCALYTGTNRDKPFFAVCVIPDAANTARANILYLYLPFAVLIISTLCFFASAVVYIFILKAKDVHRKCFVGYSISMIVTFVTLICLQRMSAACNFIGAIFMFSMICSFVWLACICIDLICIVKAPKRCPEDHTRIYLYLSISMTIPVIVLMASIIPDGIPDIPASFVKTYSGSEICSFGEVNKEMFFIPIGLLITVSVFGLGYTSCIINNHNNPDDYDWIHNKSRFKFMLRSCFLVWVTTFIWLIEVIVEVEGAFQLAIDLIEALQGIFVTIIFVLNKYIRKEIRNVIFEKKNKVEQEQRYRELLENLERTSPEENNSKSEDNNR